MAINIFQGGKPSRQNSKTATAAKSVRAKQAQGALTTPSVTSDSGATAVSKTGTLAKVGNVVGKVAGLASKFLPGVGGTIAKGIANIFNDPEWWQSVPGDAVTLNAPLRGVGVPGSSQQHRYKVKERFTFATFDSTFQQDTTNVYVINPTEQQITQYLMPQIRKVVNATPLQAAADYRHVLMVNTTLYALWQNLKRYDYMLKHGQTYIANLDDVAFPILQVENAATLQSMIGRLEEYLRSNVRLPHTLCEYLAWRFGRVYKSNTSAKSGLILYNVYSIASAIGYYQLQIANLMAAVASATSYQQANADMYNAYYDHDFMVEVAEDTQFRYDVKEFCLRTNCDIRSTWPTGDSDEPLDCVYLDSSLDNPTTFMASTVSTLGVEGAGGSLAWLFPVRVLSAFIPDGHPGTTAQGSTVGVRFSASSYQPGYFTARLDPTSKWRGLSVAPDIINPSGGDNTPTQLSLIVGYSCILKSLDIYNKDLYVWIYYEDSVDGPKDYIDVSSISMDMGLVQNTTLGNEQVYAFANLVHVGRKHSMSYKEAETLVSRDTANLVEKLDIATSHT